MGGIPLWKSALSSILICVVDDDESVRESLPDPLEELGFAVSVFASAEAYLASDVISSTRCLILDIAMPGMSGPELHRELLRRGIQTPVIFITGQPDGALHSSLLAQGAVACLLKPLSEEALCAALAIAVGRP